MVFVLFWCCREDNMESCSMSHMRLWWHRSLVRSPASSYFSFFPSTHKVNQSRSFIFFCFICSSIRSTVPRFRLSEADNHFCSYFGNFMLVLCGEDADSQYQTKTNCSLLMIIDAFVWTIINFRLFFLFYFHHWRTTVAPFCFLWRCKTNHPLISSVWCRRDSCCCLDARHTLVPRLNSFLAITKKIKFETDRCVRWRWWWWRSIGWTVDSVIHTARHTCIEKKKNEELMKLMRCVECVS